MTEQQQYLTETRKAGGSKGTRDGSTVATVSLAVAGVLLFGANAALTWYEKNAAAIAAGYAAGVLCFIFAFLARFKRFKGLGIEAELWEQKQEEAAELIDRLKSLTAIAARQLVTLSASTGRMEPLSRREKFELVAELEELMRSLGLREEQIEEAKAMHYRFAGLDLALKIYERCDPFFRRKASTADNKEERNKIASYFPDWWQSNWRRVHTREGLESLLSLINDCPYLDDNEKTELMQEMREEIADLEAWVKQHKIRRPEVFFG